MKPCHSHRALQHAAIVVQPEPIYIRTRLTRVRRVHMQFGAFTIAIVHLSLASPYHALRPRWKNDHGSCTQPLLRKPARDHREPASTLLSPVGRFVSRAAWPRTGRCIVWLHVRCCWARRRLVVLQPDLQTFANLNQALHTIHQRVCGACGAFDQSCTAQDRVCYSACYTREIVPAGDSDGCL